MRIGLDTRFLTHPQRGGFKTYTVNLVNSIHRLDDENQYFIYLDRPFEMDKLPIKKNFNYRIVNGTIPVLGMPLREQVLLRHHVIRDRLDILHSLCNTAPVGVGTKTVITLHDTIQVTTKDKLMGPSNIKSWMIGVYSKWSITRSLPTSDRVITVSEYEKSQIVDLFDVPRERIAVTHLAANEVFRPTKPEDKVNLCREVEGKFIIRGDYLLGVGYEDRKNIPLLIEAYRHLIFEFPELTLVIVSADENRRLYLQKLVRDHHLDGRVIILGSVSMTDMSALYNLAKIFVFPSERESFGLPPLEAIACGTPTIAMNSSSLPEILNDGALLVDGKDASKWSDAIRVVLTDDRMRLEMIERGLRRASELNWESCARKTIQIYSHLA